MINQDSGKKEFAEVFITLGIFFVSIFLCMIFKSEIDELGGFGLIMKVFFISMGALIFLGQITLKSEYRKRKKEIPRYLKPHYLHPFFYHVVHTTMLVVAPALVGMIFFGNYFSIGGNLNI